MPEEATLPKYMALLFEEHRAEDASASNGPIVDNIFGIIFTKLEQLKQQQALYHSEAAKLETFLKFKNLLEAHYQTSRNADFYAEKLYISYKHLNTICKSIINRTAKQFIDEFLILKAKRLLINSDIRSNQLSFEMGFKDPNNFTKYFKKHTGFTPKRFKSFKN